MSDNHNYDQAEYVFETMLVRPAKKLVNKGAICSSQEQQFFEPA